MRLRGNTSQINLRSAQTMGLIPASSPCNKSQGLVASCVPTFKNVTDSPEFCLPHSKWKKEVRSRVSSFIGTALAASEGASLLP